MHPVPLFPAKASAQPAPWLSKAQRGLLLAVVSLAALVAGALVVMTFTGKISYLRGCGGDEGCASLLGGRWGSWFLLPVSLWALLTYIGLGGLIARGLNGWWSRTLALAGTLVLVGAALWFFALQAFLEKRFCSYCSLMHVCGLLIAAILWRNLATHAFPGRVAAAQTAGWLAVVTMVGWIGGQLWGPQPATHEVRQLTGDALLAASGSPQSTVSSVADSPVPPPASPPEDRPMGITPNGAELAPREVTYMRGGIRYTIGEIPLLGDPMAEHILVKYFDYTCETCREMHEELDRLLRLYPRKLAVIVVPTPLNRSCNPHLLPSVPDHPDACELARLGLAVWRADPQQFPGFHDALFERQGHLTLEQAREVAERRVGASPLQKAEQDPWISETLRRAAEIYGGLSGSGPRMPKLLLGGRDLMNGVPRSTADLIRSLQDHVTLD